MALLFRRAFGEQKKQKKIDISVGSSSVIDRAKGQGGGHSRLQRRLERKGGHLRFAKTCILLYSHYSILYVLYTNSCCAMCIRWVVGTWESLGGARFTHECINSYVLYILYMYIVRVQSGAGAACGLCCVVHI